MAQYEVTEMLNTSKGNVKRWEMLGQVPSAPLMSRIITFIGYVPIVESASSIRD